MTAVERSGRLTWERLISSLERHHDAVAAQLPELQNAGRVHDLQQAINATLTVARAGMSGTLVASPAQVKQQLKVQIADIHVLCDAVDQAAVHAQGGAQDGTPISACTSSAFGGSHNSPLASAYQISASKRAHSPRDSSKEISIPPAAPLPQPATSKVSSVKKTPITKCAGSSKPSDNADIKKRPARNARSKAPILDLAAPPLSAPNDAQLAAAGALIKLNRSPETSFTNIPFPVTSARFATPSTNSKKRAYSVYEDDASSPYLPQSQKPASSPPALKCRMLAPATYAPVPALTQGLSGAEVFALGVEYALQYFAANEGCEGKDIRAWVEGQLGLQAPPPPRSSLNMGIGSTGGALATSTGYVSVLHSAVESGRRGFWDVV